MSDDCTDESLIEKLTESYKPTNVPPCRVCGAELSIAAVGGGEPTRYACSTQSMGNGKKIDWDHYDRSGWEDLRQGGDSRVMELINRFQKLRHNVKVTGASRPFGEASG